MQTKYGPPSETIHRNVFLLSEFSACAIAWSLLRGAEKTRVVTEVTKGGRQVGWVGGDTTLMLLGVTETIITGLAKLGMWLEVDGTLHKCCDWRGVEAASLNRVPLLLGIVLAGRCDSGEGGNGNGELLISEHGRFQECTTRSILSNLLL
ncbi:hypothetical protein E2C01_052412 [Portunus trituberculatus]|uniref:Uncharacterized protein n=1 Tax=Portunus trituberculatus TaxID=210409 RepID=A0A5B7GME3_PORTR|nr:hypothetical protein [Portunus trituberculatus]